MPIVNLDRIIQVKELLDSLYTPGTEQAQDDNGMTAELRCNCGAWMCIVKCPQIQMEVGGLDTTREGAVHAAWWNCCGRFGL